VQGSTDSRGLLLQPAFGESGTATITITVSDGQYSATQTFVVNVSNASRAGVWNGLISSEPASHAGTGVIKITTSGTGRFTAQALIGGKRESFKGKVPASGPSAPFRSLSRRATLQLEMATGKLTGTLASGALESTFAADRALFTRKAPRGPLRNVPAMWLGSFNGTFGPSSNGAPAGTGVAVVTVGKRGSVRTAGRLADGTAFAHGNALSQEGSSPLYAPLYGGSGALAGELRWAPSETGDWTSTMRWFEPGAPAEGWISPFSATRAE
jgi:hypothetical protein